MINNCIISGIIYSEPHYKVTARGTAIVSFILELDSKSGERNLRVRVKMWRAIASKLHEFFDRGDHVVVQGVVSYDSGKIPETDDYKYYNTVIAKNFDTYNSDVPINEITISGYSAGKVQLKKHCINAELITLDDLEHPEPTEGLDKPIMGLMAIGEKDKLEEKKHLWIKGTIDTYVRLNDADQKRTSLLIRPNSVKTL